MNEVHECSPIDFSDKKLVYEEETFQNDNTYHGQFKDGIINGIGRFVWQDNNKIYEG